MIIKQQIGRTHVKQKGEVDFLIDDYSNLSVVPIEVKSGIDYRNHRSLNTFLASPEYNTVEAFVLSNDREVRKEGIITYVPVYYSMFLSQQGWQKKTIQKHH